MSKTTSAVEKVEAVARNAADQAESPIIEGPWVPGRPAPKDEENPPCGDPRHRCIDLKGFYRPDWFQVYIAEQEGDSSEVLCPSTNGDPWTVKRGLWVDVPQEVIDTVSSAMWEYTEMPSLESALKNPGAQGPTRRVPRYQFNKLPSA